MKIIFPVFLMVMISGCVQSGFSTYSGQFSMQYPSDWNQTSINFAVFFSGPGELPPSMSVSSVNETIEAATEHARQLQSKLLNYRVISEDNISINEKNAFRHVYSWTDAAHNIDFTQIQVWLKDKELYTITATSLSSSFEKYKPTFDTMINSFKINQKP